MDTSEPVLGLIPARYASSRFPGKALATLGDKTLIHHTYENALRCAALDRVVIATDDSRIYEHAQSFGAEVVMTSPACPTGSDRLAEVIKNNSTYNRYDLIVNIQGDEPFVAPETIEALPVLLQADPTAVMATAAVRIANNEEISDPHSVKVVMDQHHRALYFSRSAIPYNRNENGTHYYRHIGIYGFRREFLLQYSSLPPTPLQLAEDLEQLKVLEHGYVIKVAVVEEIGIGVDTPEDLAKAEQYICKQNTYSSPAGCSRH